MFIEESVWLTTFYAFVRAIFIAVFPNASSAGAIAVSSTSVVHIPNVTGGTSFALSFYSSPLGGTIFWI